MNQHVLPAFPLFPLHSHWLRVKEKTCIHLPLLLPCTHQTHFSSQTPYYCIRIITDQSFFLDEARNAFLTLTGYIGLLFTSLNFCQRVFLETYEFNSYLYYFKMYEPGNVHYNWYYVPHMPYKKNTGPR